MNYRCFPENLARPRKRIATAGSPRVRAVATARGRISSTRPAAASQIARWPMLLDTSTLYLVATMVAAMLGAMLLFVGTQENIPALQWCGTAYLLGAASVALVTVAPDALGPLLSLAL